MPTSASREKFLKVWKEKAQAGKEGCFSCAGIVPGDVCGGGTELKPRSGQWHSMYLGFIQTISRTSNSGTSWLWWCTPNPTWEVEVEGSGMPS